jgi:hypothetical protein
MNEDEAQLTTFGLPFWEPITSLVSAPIWVRPLELTRSMERNSLPPPRNEELQSFGRRCISVTVPLSRSCAIVGWSASTGIQVPLGLLYADLSRCIKEE